MTEQTPASLGFRMPAEWEPHASTWLTWPHTPEYWPDLDGIESIYLAMIRALAKGERVDVLANSPELASDLRQRFHAEKLDGERVRVHVIPNRDIWIRDYGPTFLTHADGRVAACRWIFNVWGGKYEMPHERKASGLIRQSLGLPEFLPQIVMEGGAIEVDGQGTCLTTASCLLNPNRNPNLSRTEVETFLKNFLDVRQVVWCEGWLEGDDTDGHIDNLVRFVSADTIVCASEDDPADANFAGLRKNLEILGWIKTPSGKPYRVIPLPMPGVIRDEVKRYPASYANFYIGNAAVLAPVYGHAKDGAVLDLLGKCFPDREIVPLMAEVMVTGNGGPHCATQQQPAGAS